jgi:hypothetical protein
MTISFNPLKTNGHLFTYLPELNDLEFSLSNANAADLLDPLGIEDAFAASPWPLCGPARFAAPRHPIQSP